MKREVRTIRHAQLRAKDDNRGISGYAAVFNSPSEDLGWFREVIAPGAFSRCLGTNPDVRALFNHDPNLVLGRTKSKTLTVTEDNIGLHFDCDTPDTQVARDLQVSIDRGDVDQCSFSFAVNKQTWTEESGPDGKTITTRTLQDVDLLDISAVTYPAYTQTSVSVRSLWPDGIPSEVAAHRGAGVQDDIEPDPDDPNEDLDDDDCECDCRACYDGECDECPMHMASCDERFCRCSGGTRSSQRADGDKTTKRVDGEDLEAGAFAYVGDPEKTDTWKLPIKFSTDERTKSHIRNAIARFGQTKGIPADKKAGVWRKIAAAAKKYGIHVAGEEESDSLPDDFTENARRSIELALAEL